MDMLSSQSINAKTTASEIHPSIEDTSDATQSTTLFENPFAIEDLLVFDAAVLQHILAGGFGLTLTDIAWSIHGASEALIKRLECNLSPRQRPSFLQTLAHPLTQQQVHTARRHVLNALFWELIYWKTPELYEELTEGEQLHPAIFQQLEPDLRHKTVLDVGAGSGRASFDCIRHGAKLVYAVEPSPGLLRILQQKIDRQTTVGRVLPYQGSFEQIPLADKSVDTALSCSAFTAEPEQGGEPGLAELQRVTRSGGKIVLIWPRKEDYAWLKMHGFQYVALPLYTEMVIHFRSLQSALRCAQLFYAHNTAVLSYLLKWRKPEIPFSVLGVNPPRDYCWLTVK
ncbi:MAG: hypothetical protein NVSMB33_03660 [Ktedonobacteraceae bacterium]